MSGFFGWLADVLTFGLLSNNKGSATAGRTKGKTAEERQAVSASNAELAKQAGITQAGGRPRPEGAPIVGRAVLRGTALGQVEDKPPSVTENASAGMLSAYAAGERARKRAAAGGTVLTRAQKGLPGPTGSYAQKTLLGS